MGDRGIHCWWDLIRSKELSSVSVCRTQVFAGFSGHGNSIHNIIPLLKKRKYATCFKSNISLFTLLGQSNTPIEFPLRGILPDYKCHGYDTKASDNKDKFQDLSEMSSTPLLPFLPGPFWHRVVVPVRIQSRSQISLFQRDLINNFNILLSLFSLLLSCLFYLFARSHMITS